MKATAAQVFQLPFGVSGAVIVFAAALFSLHYPGHATYDTLAQAYDGATRIYTSNQPPAMSLLLSYLTMPGVLLLQLSVFAIAVWKLLDITGGSLRTQCVQLVVLVAFPVVLLYTGIVWKDVLFAHGALLALLLLPALQAPRLRSLIISAVVLAVAVSVRQQGILVVLVVLVYLLFSSGIRLDKVLTRTKGALQWLVVFFLCTACIKFVVNNSGDTTQSGSFEGPLRQLAMFDLGGVLKAQPQITFPAIESGALEVPIENRPTRDRVIEQLQRYSPQRQDFMAEPADEPNMWIKPSAWFRDWGRAVALYPRAYVEHRLNFMEWLLGCHDPRKCLPFTVGVPSEPQVMAKALGVETGISDRANVLNNIGNASIFLFRPWIYLLLSLMSLLYLVQRDWRGHGPMILLQISGLLYAASYFFIGIACDFRYTYFSTISGVFGFLYVAGLVSESLTRSKD